MLVSGDEEYRSEEALPQLGQDPGQASRLQMHRAVRHRQGRRHDQPERERQHSRPRGARLGRPDVDLFTRFRDLPDDQMKHIVDYVESGRPIIGLRTATHAFNIKTARPEVRPVRLAEARSGTAASAGRCWAKPGSTTTASTASKARAAIVAGREETPDPARHQATATSGVRPTSTASACRCPATASRWCWARCWPA